MRYTSDSVKMMNTNVFLKSLFHMKNGTINEFVNETKLSTSTIRTIIIENLEASVIRKMGIEKSSGGRCATRYEFINENLQMILIILHDNDAFIYVYDIYYNEVFKTYINVCEKYKFITTMQNLIKVYKANCIYISVDGIPENYSYINDVTGKLVKKDLLIELKKKIETPIFLENDVKARSIGYMRKNSTQYKNVAYLYLGQNGMGSSFIIDSKIIRGTSNFAGEIGLINYKTKSINDWLREELSDEFYIELVAQILLIVITLFDPEVIVFSGKAVRRNLHDRVIDVCTISSYRKRNTNFDYDTDINNQLYGIFHLSSMYLLKKLSERNLVIEEDGIENVDI